MAQAQQAKAQGRAGKEVVAKEQNLEAFQGMAEEKDKVIEIGVETVGVTNPTEGEITCLYWTT